MRDNKFNYTTGLMFGVNDTIKNWKYNFNNPFEYQNDFIYNSTGIENVLYKLNSNILLEEGQLLVNKKN